LPAFFPKRGGNQCGSRLLEKGGKRRGNLGEKRGGQKRRGSQVITVGRRTLRAKLIKRGVRSQKNLTRGFNEGRGQTLGRSSLTGGDNIGARPQRKKKEGIGSPLQSEGKKKTLSGGTTPFYIGRGMGKSWRGEKGREKL